MTRVMKYWFVFCSLGLSAFAAAPTIKWQLAYPAPNPDAKRLVPANTWYEIRAEASDADGNLAELKIYRDGAPFAFAGPGSAAGNGSVLNWGGYNYDSPGVHVFTAQAVDATGQYSPVIYWVTKVSASGSDRITFADLEVHFPVASNEAWFPNSGNPITNAANLADVAASLGGTSGKTLSFKDEAYFFDVSYNRRNKDQWSEPSNIDSTQRYNPGRPIVFQGVSNFTLKGSSVGQTVLRWASYDSFGSVFHQNDNQNNVIGFLEFQDASVNIWVQNLGFDTEYLQRKDTGNHLRIHNQGFYLNNCKFYRSTSFAVLIAPQQAATEPAHVHIDSSIFANTYSDGIHVMAGEDIWFVGNVFSNTGDDAIAFINHESSDQPSTRFTRNFHVIWNYIENSRGIGIGGSTLKGTASVNSEISYNTIITTGSSGIVLYNQTDIPGYSGPYSTPVEWIQVLENTIQYAGLHSNPVNNDPGRPRSAFELRNARNIIGYQPGQTSGWNRVKDSFRRLHATTNGYGNGTGNPVIGLSNDSNNNGGDLTDGTVTLVLQP